VLNPRQILAFSPCQDVRFGSKADIRGAKSHVRFTPECDIKCDMWNVPQKAQSGHSHYTAFTGGLTHLRELGYTLSFLCLRLHGDDCF